MLESASAGAVPENGFLGQRFTGSELIIGLVGAVGTNLTTVISELGERLKVFGYETQQVRVSTDIIPQVATVPEPQPGKDEFKRISAFMDAGNAARAESGDNSILALGVAARIAAARPIDLATKLPGHVPRRAFIVNSLKHPAEVARLREIYPEAFYLIGVHSDASRRREYLTEEKRLTGTEPDELIQRDEDEHLANGQRTSDTFHMSDFFIKLDANHDESKHSIWRILDILFGSPTATPTFDEYAMFMAFAASLRSADLSRQVGAVIAQGHEIIATGANDCPKSGGGLYWPEHDKKTSQTVDAENGRDYKRGEDSNQAEQYKIVEDIITMVGDDIVDRAKLREALSRSRIKDLTEYGRVVHAEMEALLSCARNHVSSKDATLYCTTFPCHNCAKHIIAAGIRRVVFVEPYPKSKAIEFHDDSLKLGFSEEGPGEKLVCFEPFVGVGPRRFFDLFSMRLGSGYPLQRKDDRGCAAKWRPEASKLRIQMIPCSYIELETVAASMFNEFRERKESPSDRK